MAFKNVQNNLFILVFIFFTDPMSCKHNEPVSFTRNTVSDLTLTKDTAFVSYFSHAEERQKLCYFAKMVADLAYVDYSNDFIPTWHNIESSEYSYGMYCATLPTVYIVRQPLNPVLQITFIQPAVDEFEFNANIVVAKSVNPKEPEDTSVESDWIKLSAESRQYFCNTVRKLVSPLHFLDHEVAAAQPYVFEDFASKTETRDAFSCPTLPRLYLRPDRNSEKKIEIVRLPSFLDDYEFEVEETNPTLTHRVGDKANIHAKSNLSQLNQEERKSLCAVARRYYVHSFAQDNDAHEAHLYPFQYRQEEPEVHNVTILCSALPPMYLRSDNEMNNDKKTKISITFVRTAADLYSYDFEVLISAYRKVETSKTDEKQLANHLFSTFSKEDTWNLCSAAQKYILSDKGRCLNFTFAENHGIFFNLKLLLVPGHVNTAQVYEIERLDKEWETDVLIKCSEWPRMFLRRNNSEEKIKINLMKYELKAIPTW